MLTLFDNDTFTGKEKVKQFNIQDSVFGLVTYSNGVGAITEIQKGTVVAVDYPTATAWVSFPSLNGTTIMFNFNELSHKSKVESQRPKVKGMTAKAALCQALLDGRTINIKNCFETIGYSNAPREISRMIEKPFGVIVSRMRMEGESRYGQPVTWFDYRLNPLIEGNKEGIIKMKEYVNNSLNK